MLYTRLLDQKTKTKSFTNGKSNNTIQRIYVINLDRKPDRWRQINRELSRIRNRSGAPLSSISRRFSAIDARYFNKKIDTKILQPYYTLADQLLVEPNKYVQIDKKSRARRIEMTPQEVAIALSHIEVWKLVASSKIDYTLILEDDVYFRYDFARDIDSAWNHIMRKHPMKIAFDLLYLSFQDVGENTQLRKRSAGIAHRPDHGLWQASGYVLSKKGAQKLLELLPAHGPIDLWLNLQFKKLDVLTTYKPIIEQRIDVTSTNSYSVMPILSQIGVHTREKPPVVQTQKLPGPIFAYGEKSSGLTSLATALSMIGYTCCSDTTELPAPEYDSLITKRHRRTFNAYVNIGSLNQKALVNIAKSYPEARLIITAPETPKHTLNIQNKILYLPYNHQDKWGALCTFLEYEYPAFPYPACDDLGQREVIRNSRKERKRASFKQLRFDSSPWIILPKKWSGIPLANVSQKTELKGRAIKDWVGGQNNERYWRLRDDTFPSNLALFTPDNIEVDDSGATKLILQAQKTPVRSFTSAAIAARRTFLYGKFSAEVRPTNTAGLVTGLFLHRNSPYQEIDIEFPGNDTTRMLINVFYNPGIEGTKLEYGYRGTPVLIELGFDAAEDFHYYEIEWQPNIIRWRVDGHIVYERVFWDPTPIPNLPMEMNVNLWHSRSKELAGKLNKLKLPAQTEIRSIKVTQN